MVIYLLVFICSEHNFLIIQIFDIMDITIKCLLESLSPFWIEASTPSRFTVTKRFMGHLVTVKNAQSKHKWACLEIKSGDGIKKTFRNVAKS